MTDAAPSRGTRTESTLPGVLAEVAEVAGHEAAIKLALAWGGDWIHFPKPAHLARHPDHPLAALLGEGTATAVALRVGGGAAYIPRARRACVRHLWEQGIEVAAIAARLHTGRDTVRKYIRAA